MWAQPEAGAEVPLALRPARLPRDSRAPQIWLPSFGCLAPASWSPGPLATRGPRDRATDSGEANLCGAAQSGRRGPPPHPASGPPSSGETRGRGLSSEGKRGARTRRRARGWSSADPEAASRRGGWVRQGRALGPRGRGSSPSSGGRARGLGGWAQAAAASRRRPEPGARPERGAGCGAAACPAPLARACRPPAMPGFDYKFLEKPKRRLLCPLCGKPMREPVQVSTCGHRFCDTCLQEFLRCGPGGSGERPVATASGGDAWGGTRAGGTPGLCLRRGSVTSGAPAVTSRGGGDVRPRGGTPRTNPKGPGAHRRPRLRGGGGSRRLS